MIKFFKVELCFFYDDKNYKILMNNTNQQATFLIMNELHQISRWEILFCIDFKRIFLRIFGPGNDMHKLAKGLSNSVRSFTI